MYDLLDVDNLLRRIRRHAARFAVLGGQLARAVDEPIRLLDLIRGAVAEIERLAAEGGSFADMKAPAKAA